MAEETKEPDLQKMTRAYLENIFSKRVLSEEKDYGLINFQHFIASKSTNLDPKTVEQFIFNNSNIIHILNECINNPLASCDDSVGTIRTALELFYASNHQEKAGVMVLDEPFEQEVYFNPSEERFIAFLSDMQSIEEKDPLKTLLKICEFMRGSDKNNYGEYGPNLIPFLQKVLTSKKDSPDSLFSILNRFLPEDQDPELFNEIYNWIVYYVSKYLFNANLVSLINIQIKINNQHPLTLLNENESSENDFKHILLISGFMIFSRKSKYDLYSKDINIGDNSVSEFDVEFLNRILEYRIFDENELYFILKVHLPKDMNFDLMYNGFMYNLLEYFNILNIMSSFDPPPSLKLETPKKPLSFLESQEDEALPEPQENLIEKKYRLDLHYQIQHY